MISMHGAAVTACVISNWEERVQAGKTTYTADSHPNSTTLRHGNSMNVNGYKNTEDTQKQSFIKGKMGVPPWNGQRQMSL